MTYSPAFTTLKIGVSVRLAVRFRCSVSSGGQRSIGVVFENDHGAIVAGEYDVHLCKYYVNHPLVNVKLKAQSATYIP